MVTIKNVPGIVGTIADVVDLKDEVVLVSPSATTSKHGVASDPNSVLEENDLIDGSLLSNTNVLSHGVAANV